MKAKHQDESGRPTTTRGKAPHKGGYSAKNKGCNPFKVWFEIGEGTLDGKARKVTCPWYPGARS